MRCLSESQLFAVADGHLDADVRAAVEEHIDRCATCRRTVAALLDSGAEPSTHLDLEALRPGIRIGRYIIEGVLGSGGMGIVYAARDPELERTVALKVVFGETQRIRREAQVMARLSHPNIVPVYSIVSSELGDFLAMEHIRGPSLRRWLDTAARPTRAIVDVFVGAARGLSAAHRAGIVHRDFKPDNVLLAGHGTARITDFGLSVAPMQSISLSCDPNEQGETPVGGTPAYAAPEQLCGGPPSPLADQYSFCVSLFEALTGRRPPRGGPDSLRATPRVPASLRRILRRGLEDDPHRRFASMDTLAESLEGVGGGSVLSWGVPLAATAAMVGLFAWQRPPETSTACSPSAIDHAWSKSRRQTLEAAGGRDHPEMTGRVTAELDRYVERWRDESEDVCERRANADRQGRQRADLQQACLVEQILSLDTLVSLLEESPDVVRVRGLSAVHDLESPGECIRKGPSPSSTLEPLNAGAAKLSEAAVAAKGLGRIGRAAEGLALLRVAVRESASVRTSPALEARVHYTLGALHFAVGHQAEAVDFLESAFWRAVAGAEYKTAFLASRDLASVAVRVYDWERAERWLRQAQAQADRLSAPPRLAVDLNLVRGNLHLRRGELGQAHSAFARGEQLAVDAGLSGASTLRLAHSVARLVGKRSGPKEALSLHRVNLERRRALLGPHHPDVADSLVSVAANQVELYELDDAISNFEEALGIYEVAVGPDAEAVLDTLENLGGVLSMTGRFDESRAHLNRLLELAEGADDALLAGHVSINLGDVCLMSQRAEAAERHFRRALRLLESRLDATDPLIGHAVGGLGEAYLELGRAGAAVDYLERSLAIRAEHPEELVMLARARTNLARALWDSQRNRVRAHELAVIARDALPQGDGRVGRVRTYIEAWLRDHPAPPR